MIHYSIAGAILLLTLLIAGDHIHGQNNVKFTSEVRRFMAGGGAKNDDSVGTRWAVLLAGSSGYINYRHQADVCHAYQILKKGGIKDENIIVFMYDDIAYNAQNPRPGVIINSPNGEDVYQGVPKDYVGEEGTANNFYAVILGNKTGVTGGSGKVVDSGPNDHIFIYYTDHGAPGLLLMPSGPQIYANDLIQVLKQKYASGTYKSMVIYVEACESGSIFEGILPEGLNIYATTASNANESSWAYYCPGMDPSPPPEYTTCLGDLYSIAWLENSESHDLKKESLRQQYQQVKNRTANKNYDQGSHVMRYGDLKFSSEKLFTYIGSNSVDHDHGYALDDISLPSKAVNQRDADLLHLWDEYSKAPLDSARKLEALQQLAEAIGHRLYVENSMKRIGELLFGSGAQVLKMVRPAGKPLVDDWDCLKSLVRTFESHCGSLSTYGMKHTRSFANICNAGVNAERMAAASFQACSSFSSKSWSSPPIPKRI